MNTKVSKGLKSPVVTLPGVEEHMLTPGKGEKDAAQVFYVSAPRTTQTLVMGTTGNSTFRVKLLLTRPH